MVQERREEDLNLDFKEVQAANLGPSDRKNFAKAVSAFSNSAGGLLVWRIEARPDADGIDRAQARRPVQSLAMLLGKLNEFIASAASPTKDVVQHRALEERTDSGYVVTFSR